MKVHYRSNESRQEVGIPSQSKVLKDK